VHANGPSVIAGLFVSATTLFDWYLNAPLNVRPLSADELYRYEMFLDRPRQVIAAPDLANDWWMVVLFAAVLFLLGYIAVKLATELYQSRFISINNAFLATIALAALIMGFCAGYLLLMTAYMLPLVWKIYLSMVTAMLTFLGTFLILRSPYQLYLWWKQTSHIHT